MKKLAALLLLPLTLFLGSCSEVEELLNTQENIDTLVDCFPELYEKVDQILVIADTWRDNEMPANPPNPAGLNATVSGGVITVDYTIPSTTCRVDMTIRFYSPTGAEQSLTITQDTLANMMDQAATELGTNLFPNMDPFMVGTWTWSDGSGGTGSGAMTGIIGGVMNQNELERLISTESTPMGARPADSTGTITLTTTGGDLCTVVFNTVAPTHVETDTPASQNYPVGALQLVVTGPDATVTSTASMDGTVNATITTSALPGDFTLNLDTYSVTYNP